MLLENVVCLFLEAVCSRACNLEYACFYSSTINVCLVWDFFFFKIFVDILKTLESYPNFCKNSL